MVKLAFLGFLLVIAASDAYTDQERKNAIEEIKNMIKNPSFMSKMIDCMYSLNMLEAGVCNSFRMRTAKELLVVAYIYEELTKSCLEGEPDKLLLDSCDIYRSLNASYPYFWTENQAAIKYAVDNRPIDRITLPKDNFDYYGLLLADPTIGITVAECIIYRLPCFGALSEIQDLLLRAERFEKCIEYTEKGDDPCRILYGFQTYYTKLWKAIKVQGKLYEYDEDLQSKHQYMPYTEGEL